MEEWKIGDTVTRTLAGIKMPLKITAFTDTLIICGGDEKEHTGWWFDKATGAEIDEELGWGAPPMATGSYLEEIAVNPKPRGRDEVFTQKLLRTLRDSQNVR